MDAYFMDFDKDCDGYLNIGEFDSICRVLFRNDKGKLYSLSEEQLRETFDIFDLDKIVRPVSAFLIIDVQNDFISGSLSISQCSAQQNGLDVINPINNLLETVNFDAVVYSLDWHPSDHISFIDNLKNRTVHPSSVVKADKAQLYDTVTFDGPHLMEQRLWPRHCVQDSWGAELHKDLKVVESATKVYKGTNPEVDSYSAFWDNKKLTQTSLLSQLKQKNVTDLYICGLAYDVCVGATAADALSLGYRTILIDDCCRGVDLADIEKTKDAIVKNHGVIVTTNEVKAMVEGRDRRSELGYKLALELKKKTTKKQGNVITDAE